MIAPKKPFVPEPLSNYKKASTNYAGYFTEIRVVDSIEEALKSFDAIKPPKSSRNVHPNFLVR